jgi:hypothetical protein
MVGAGNTGKTYLPCSRRSAGEEGAPYGGSVDFFISGSADWRAPSDPPRRTKSKRSSYTPDFTVRGGLVISSFVTRQSLGELLGQSLLGHLLTL